MIVQADARRLPFPDRSVDLIITSPPYWTSWNVQNGRYWAFIDELVAEFKRVSKSYWMLIRTVDGDQRWIQDDRLGPRGRFIPVYNGWGRFYDEDVISLLNLHSQAGDVVLDPLAGSGVVATWANRMGRIGIASDLEVKHAHS